MSNNTQDIKNNSIVKTGSNVITFGGSNFSEVFNITNIAEFPHTDEVIGRRVDPDGKEVTFYKVPDGVYVQAYDEKTSTSTPAKVTCWSEHKNLEIEIVQLRSGKHIITDNDPRAVYGIPADTTTMKLERFTPTEALKRGVMVPAVYNHGERYALLDWDCGPDWITNVSPDICEITGVSQYVDWEDGLTYYFDLFSGKIVDAGDEDELDPYMDEYFAGLDESQVDEEGDTVGLHEFSLGKLNNYKFVPMDFEFGQFIGCMAGDGWWDHSDMNYPAGFAVRGKRRLYLSDNIGCNGKFIEGFLKKYVTGDLKVYTKKMTKDQDPGRYGDSERYSYCAVEFEKIANTLTAMLGGDRDKNTAGSGNKKLPAWVLATPKEFRWGIIAGLLDTDGTISVNTSNKRSAPQLEVSVTSTSLRLLEDAQSVLSSLGVASRIGFSKVTVANNASWILSVSTPSLKANEDKLKGMCHQAKYENLKKTPVVLDDANAIGIRKIVFPKSVAELVLRWIQQPRVESMPTDESKKWALDSNNLAACVRRGRTMGYVTQGVADRIVKYMTENIYNHSTYAPLKAFCIDLMSCAPEDTRRGHRCLFVTTAQIEEANSLVTDMFSSAIRETYAPAEELFKTAYTVIRKWKANGLKDKYIKEADVATLLGVCHALQDIGYDWYILNNSLFVEWMDVAAGGFTWDKVIGVDYTGIKETGYDITVPGYETFVGGDGLVRSNTVNLHVPASDAAVKESMEKLMPSLTPFSNREAGSIVPMPKQEQILGLYTAATAPSTGEVKKFSSEEEAMDAIRRGQVKLSDDIEFPGMDKVVGITPQM